MAWSRPGDKPLSEPMMVSLPTHIYASLGLNELRWTILLIEALDCHFTEYGYNSSRIVSVGHNELSAVNCYRVRRMLCPSGMWWTSLVAVSSTRTRPRWRWFRSTTWRLVWPLLCSSLWSDWRVEVQWNLSSKNNPQSGLRCEVVFSWGVKQTWFSFLTLCPGHWSDLSSKNTS